MISRKTSSGTSVVIGEREQDRAINASAVSIEVKGAQLAANSA